MNGELNISKEMKAVKSDIQDIMACYRSKPNVQFKHVQCDYNGHHIDFTYKSHHNFANAVHSTIRRYRLYIDTRKATENDLRRLL